MAGQTERLSKKSFFWDLIRVGIVPAVCSSLIMLLIAFSLIDNSARSVDSSNGERIVSAFFDVFEDTSEKAAACAEYISKSSWFHSTFIDHCIAGKTITANTGYEITRDLLKGSVSVPYIKQITVRYFLKPNSLFTTHGYYENIAFYEEFYPEKLEYVFFDFQNEMSSAGFAGEELIVYSYDIADVENSKAKARVNIVLDGEKLLTKLNESTENKAAEYTVLSKSGEILWKGINENVQGEKCTEIEKISGDGLIYRVSVPDSVFHYTRRKSLGFLILCAIFDILLVAFIAVYYSKKKFSIIRKTVDKYVDILPETGNELDKIDITLENVISEKNKVKKTVNTLSPYARNTLLKALFEGSMNVSIEERAVFSQCGIVFSYRFYRVLMIALSGKTDVPETGGHTLNYFEKLIENLKEKSEKAYVCSLGNDRYAFLMNGESVEAVNDYLGLLANSIKSLNVPVYAGCGETVSEIKDIPESFEQSEKALNYAILRECSKIITYDAVKDIKTEYHEFSHTDELLLISSIKDADYDKAMGIIDNVFDLNRNLIHPGSYILYLSVKTAIIGVAEEYGIAADADDALNKNFTMQDYRDRLVKLTETVCDGIDILRMKVSKKRAHEIVDYINENLYDPTLSLSKVAEVYGCSAANISEIVHKITGEKYTDYINRKRIEHAVELIHNCNVSMNRVYTQVGYVSMTTFRRNYQRFAENSNKRSNYEKEKDGAFFEETT